MATIPKRKPQVRRVSMRTAVTTLDGAQRPYPVYRFSGRQFFERPKHNPFQGL